MRRYGWMLSMAGLGVLLLAAAAGAEQNRWPDTWTDPDDPALPKDAAIQGEYVGDNEGQKYGAQVIALGDQRFHAVLLPGGLPGDGWDGEHRILLDGRLEDDQAIFEPATPPRSYLHQDPEQFSATREFPPPGHKEYEATIADGTMTVVTDEGKTLRLERTVRKSPTLGAEPPEGATVLFDGSNKDAWRGGRLDEETGLLNTDGSDILSVDRFNDFTLHVEFMLPFRPNQRGQGRGNSGVYLVDHYEVQVLDSFGLEGLHNECGGIYTKHDCDVNTCLPPLQWQTYDIEFTNARRDEDGNKISNARATVRFNGVVIHDDVEIDGPTGGHRGEPEGTPGPLKLQGHGNPLQYRNIWIVEKDGQ